MPTPFSIPVRVYLEDTDAGGIVYHANYLKYMERARSEWLRNTHTTQTALWQTGVAFVVHSMELAFKSPAKLEQLLTVSVTPTKIARSYLLFQQSVTDADSPRVFCEASVKIACVRTDTLKPTALPHRIRADLQATL